MMRFEWAESAEHGTVCVECGSKDPVHVWHAGAIFDVIIMWSCCGNHDDCDCGIQCEPLLEAPEELLVERDAYLQSRGCAL